MTAGQRLPVHSQCCLSGAWLRRQRSCRGAPWPWRLCSPQCTRWWWAPQRGPSQSQREASWASPTWGSTPRSDTSEPSWSSRAGTSVRTPRILYHRCGRWQVSAMYPLRLPSPGHPLDLVNTSITCSLHPNTLLWWPFPTFWAPSVQQVQSNLCPHSVPQSMDPTFLIAHHLCHVLSSQFTWLRFHVHPSIYPLADTLSSLALLHSSPPLNIQTPLLLHRTR